MAASILAIGVVHVSIGTARGALKTPVDFDGDQRTDFVVARDTGGQATWYRLNSLGFSAVTFGVSTDAFLPADYDGDYRADPTVWRPGPQAYFYRLNSSNGAFVYLPFGTTLDDPSIVGDYDGDGVTDMAVYRSGAPGQPSFWFVLRSTNGSVLQQQWGQGGDFVAPGDYDGDNKADFVVQRNVGGVGGFFILASSGGTFFVPWGLPSDLVVPGDYDGDGRTDISVVRNVSGVLQWYIRRQIDGGLIAHSFGVPSDLTVQGDYDRDGRTDIAVWRSSPTPGQSAFYLLLSNSGGAPEFVVQQWGQNGDYPVATYNTH
jgi:hypothetical protein